jgi:4-amino-4-deoxy-L-arabinose transferase-like glycosyltransferase
MMPKSRDQRIGLVFVVAVILAALIALDHVPAVWWDEGWTMSVAKNWVERGHYGQLQNGEPSSPALTAAFPTVASVALSFKLLGVGVWQGRLPIVLYTFASLGVLYWLARKLYDQRIAKAALVVLLCFAPAPFLQPLFVGRQVLAEMPMMFFLLIGYVTFWLALTRSGWWVIGAILAWGVGLITKAQAMPFWIISLILPIAVAVFHRRRRLVILLAIGLIGGYAASRVWLALIDLVLSGHTITAPPVVGLYDVMAVVLTPAMRLITLVLTIQTGLPTLFGLIYAAWRWFKTRAQHDTDRDVMRLMLLALAASWFAWYAALSQGVTRYLFPPIFVGSLCVAHWLSEMTDAFDFKAVIQRWQRALRQRHLNRRVVSTWAMACLMLAMFARGGLLLIDQLRQEIAYSPTARDAAAYVNQHAPPDALIETYDAEEFLFLNRRYHYPPDQIHVELIARIIGLNQLALSGDVSEADWRRFPIDYDPLSVQPDYIIVGPFSHDWRLYAPVIDNGSFERVYANLRYEVYARAAPSAFGHNTNANAGQ